MVGKRNIGGLPDFGPVFMRLFRVRSVRPHSLLGVKFPRDERGLFSLEFILLLLILLRASPIDRNHNALRRSWRRRPLNDLMYALFVGFPKLGFREWHPFERFTVQGRGRRTRWPVRTRLRPTCSLNHCPDGPKAGHALAIKLNLSSGTDLVNCPRSKKR